MNLSRAAKKFRDQTPRPVKAPRPAPSKSEKNLPPPAPVPEPVPQPVELIAPAEPVVETIPEVAAEVPTTTPDAPAKKSWPEKTKRPRFVRATTEKRERASVPVLPPRSANLAAKLLTKNLIVPPKEENPKAGR
jgi:hypothetical protein